MRSLEQIQAINAKAAGISPEQNQHDARCGQYIREVNGRLVSEFEIAEMRALLKALDSIADATSQSNGTVRSVDR